VAAFVSAAALACVLWPLGWEAGRDSFPLSSYPMFAHGRTDSTLNAIYALAFDADGARHWVPTRLVGSREVLQARAVYERAARGGKRGLPGLCRSIAGRIAAIRTGELAAAVEVRILHGRHDSIAYFESGTLGEERALISCRVPR
jgi:hypothetical protein